MMFMKTTVATFVESVRDGGLTMKLLRHSCSWCQYEQYCQRKGQQAEFS